MLKIILYLCHDHVSSSHLGFRKTFDKIKSRYFWPHMAIDVKNYVDTCIHCQTRKRRYGHPPGLLMPIQSSGPWKIVGIDILESFPKSVNYGNRYIIVCTDLFTKYVELRAVPDATAETVADFLLNQVIYRHSVMQKLLSDRGRQLISEVFKELLALLGVNQVFTTAYHPSTNGNVERFNSTLANTIAMYVDSRHQDWDLNIQAHTFAYNASCNKSTRYSPFELMYGRKPVLPFENATPQRFTNLNTYSEYLQKNFKDALELARINLDSAQQAYKTQFDKNRIEVDYAIGEKVLIKKPVRKVGHSTKLFHDWSGPYIIKSKLSPLVFEVVNIPGKRSYYEKVPVVRLKPFKSNMDIEEIEIDAIESDPGSQVSPVSCTAVPQETPGNTAGSSYYAKAVLSAISTLVNGYEASNLTEKGADVPFGLIFLTIFGLLAALGIFAVFFNWLLEYLKKRRVSAFDIESPPPLISLTKPVKICRRRPLAKQETETQTSPLIKQRKVSLTDEGSLRVTVTYSKPEQLTSESTPFVLMQ